MHPSLLPISDDSERAADSEPDQGSARADGLPRVGEVVDGKYTITKLIGEGGMGLVYEAFHQRLGHAVAIKFLHPEAAQTPGALDRFEREARAAAELRGHHVARVLDVDTTRIGAPYMVMELLRGRDLEAELRVRGALPVEEAVDVVLQACDAMSEAHARGIVHRDLKPSNIFLAEVEPTEPCVSAAPVVKVLDFGVSLFATAHAAPRVTATYMSIGTPMYMSPEQVRCSKRVDARTDVWSLGVVLYEALVGEPPFDGASTAAVAAIVADETPSARASRPDVPSGLDTVIGRALAKDVGSRYQSVEALAAALAPFGSGRIRIRSRASFGDLARTWLAWPPSQNVLARTPAKARSSAGRTRRGELMRRARVIVAIGTCVVVLPAITFGFARDGVHDAHGPVRCVETFSRTGVEAAPTSAPATLSEVETVPAHDLMVAPRQNPGAVRRAEPAATTPSSIKPARVQQDDPLYL